MKRHQAMNRIQALVKANLQASRQQTTPTRIENAAGEATIFLYDVIDPFFGVSAERFVKDLMALTVPTIHLRINSPGGDVMEARAIATAVRQHSSKIIAHVDGMAVSAASWVALAAREVEISDGAWFMIHNAWSFGWGNAEDLRGVADFLDRIDDDLVREYVAETGNDEKQVRDWMTAETWFNADEALEKGFADRKAAPFDGNDDASNAWDLSVYAHAPKALLESAAPAVNWTEQYERAQRIARAL